jgi:hypothetical protein
VLAELGRSPPLTPSGAPRYARLMEFRFELDPREADRFVRGLVPRQELVYRLAIRGICPKWRELVLCAARSSVIGAGPV